MEFTLTFNIAPDCAMRECGGLMRRKYTHRRTERSLPLFQKRYEGPYLRRITARTTMATSKSIVV